MDESSAPIDVARYRVGDTGSFVLSDHDSSETGSYGPGGKKAARSDLEATLGRLDEMQRIMWAQRRHKLLVVLQAMDTGGKDGAIRKVFGRLNPQGVAVANFRKPTDPELTHDYLWRVHAHTPGSGMISVFNRSHYEDVLVVRVLGLVPEERWRPRYGHIRDFERLLTDEGTTVVKFFLNISKQEQRERLQARVDDPTKHWKFNRDDLDHRALWDEYMAAFEEAIGETSTPGAPWYVVPADKKWFRDIVVATVVEQTLAGMGLSYPESEEGLEALTIQ